MPDERAELSAKRINDLRDDQFAYIEPGGTKDESGRTVPRSKRHFPIHDAAHVRNALQRASQSPFGKKAMPKILAAAKKFGIQVNPQGRQDPMADIERRYTFVPVEVRATGDKRRIGGYAAVFNRPSKNLGGFVETVNPAAFNDSRGRGWPGVIARYNHDDNMLLGTTDGGTLRLSVDDTGLVYEVDPPQARQDIVELVERGDVRKSSFAFRTVEDDWIQSDQGFPQRNLLLAQLVDVAPVNMPAYGDTTAGLRSDQRDIALRSLARKFDASYDEVLDRAARDELRSFFARTDNIGPKKQATFGPAARMALLARERGPLDA